MSEIRILVMEDQLDEAKLYARMIKDLGYESAFVTKSYDAFKYMETNKVDILLSDVYLKEDHTGIQLIPQFKQKYPELVIIMLTHSMEIHDQVAAIESGAFDYLSKPFDKGLFKQRISMAVDKVKYERLKKDTGRC